MKKITRKWLNYARIDIGTAEEIIDDDTLTPSVTFHCHQCIEKVFKALLAEHEIIPPKTHNLLQLLRIIKDKIAEPDISFESIEHINETYIDSRYPDEIELLQEIYPSRERAKSFLVLAKEIATKINTMITGND
jgi:HEPN domain-containing protein